MTIKFLKLHIHHFLSFNDATIDLTNKGYCLVLGINKNPKDAARSNGSGKSTIWNAISYALVGETLSGVRTNLANNYYGDGCYVEVEFEVDNQHYKLIRSKDDCKLGTNLKIIINNEDKSGKGIRESQAILDQYLPDLTSELIGSVIMLGQGLPQKFTSNSPSGRKEVLEHLSKSDFMIQDLKERIDNRLNVLNVKAKEVSNCLLSLNSKKIVYDEQLAQNEEKLLELSKNIDYESVINKLDSEIKQKNSTINMLECENNNLTSEKENLALKVNSASDLKHQRLENVYNQYVEYNKDIIDRKSIAYSHKCQVEKDIQSMKNIKDICPLCGQKIPNVIRHDTSAKEQELVRLIEVYSSISREEEDNNFEYKEAKTKIENMFNEEVKQSISRIDEITKLIISNKATITQTTSELNSLLIELTKIKTERDNRACRLKEVNTEIEKINKCLNDISNESTHLNESAVEIENHINVVNKMNTLVKRDFRGVLLEGIVKFIDTKTKEYALKIFNSNKLDFTLDGNNVDILFENKDYDNLSGGEKQRVDIIVQFAIRDMMSRYLNFSSNILVLDEITDALDSTSCDKVINFITEELKDVESVFIISHHAEELMLPEDSKIVIEKNELGISEVK